MKVFQDLPDWLAFLQTPAAQAMIKAKGMTPG
jgi:hypothetical protein